MFARKSLLVIITTLFIKGIEVITFFLATNKYLETEFGYLAIARSLFTFFVFFSDLNFNVAHVTKMAEKSYEKNTYFSSYFMLKIILLPMICLAFFIFIQIEIVAGFIEGSLLLEQTIYMLILAAIVNSVNLVYQGSFQAEMKITKMQSGNVIATVIKAALTILIVLFVDGFLWFVSLFLVYEIVTLTINILFGRYFRFTLASVNRNLMKGYLRFGTLYFVNSIMSTIYTNLGPILLKDVLGEEALGVYYVISRLLYFFSLIHTSFYTLLLPKVASSFKENKMAELQSNILVYQKYMLILWGTITIVCFGSGTVILKLLGGEYKNQGLVLLLFEVVTCFNWAWTPFFVIILLKEDPRFLLFGFISLAISCFSWAFLPSIIGILALDFGKYVANFPNDILVIYFIYKKYGFGKPVRFIAIILLLVSGLIILQICLGMNRMPSLQAVFFTGAILGSFFLLLFVFRVLNRVDLRFVKKVLSPRHLVAEMRSDFKYNESIPDRKKDWKN